MMLCSSRRGSALLVVLGMVSFMVISAVAFSAYMRYSRLPSSYLRRTSATRSLVKAALAEAIDAVDRSIGNNPHPGVGTGNLWNERVFMGVTNNVGGAYASRVSPLCVEALAYIPPPLVNPARYWSMQSQTTYWQTFAFDAGRYVWCALDVSDYLDVNRLLANEHRSSSPARRVSLSYLFENSSHTSAGSGAEKWDSAMADIRGEPDENTFLFEEIKSKFPLISMADFNLWLGDKGPFGDFDSTFCQYYGRGGSDGDPGFIREIDSGRMTFITDSKFIPPDQNETDSNGNKIFDLNDPQCQPFASSYLANKNPDPWGAIMGLQLNAKAKNEMDVLQVISGLGCAALYDYLDEDHYPISLAVPTVERVPMICGIDAQMTGAKFGFTKDYTEKDDKGVPLEDGDGSNDAPSIDQIGQTRQVHQTVIYKISPEFAKGLQGGTVRALACFPFARKDEADGNFKIDGRLSFFLTDGDVSLRAGSPTAPYLIERNIPETTWSEQTGVIHAKLQPQSVNLTGKEFTTEEQALQTVPIPLGESFPQIQAFCQEREFIKVEYEWTQTAKKTYDIAGVGTAVWEPKWSALAKSDLTVKSAACRLPPSKWENGTWKQIDDDFKNSDSLKNYLQGTLTGSGKTLSLRAAVWLRVKEGDRTVDMVPASLEDDSTMNATPSTVPAGISQELGLGSAQPLMLFDTLATFNCTLNPDNPDGLDKRCSELKDISIEPKAMFCADPRYNHAPEDWYRTTSDLTPSEWLSSVRYAMSGNNRDSDIFMATSDAGYLQSRYELAFLSRLTDLARRGGDVVGNYTKVDDPVMRTIPCGFNNTRHHALAWLTYDPMDITDYVPWLSEGSGFKINPYSDSTNVLMAAFANTPLDWKRASTNAPAEGGVDYAAMTASEFNNKYAWNEYSSGGGFAWDDLEQIAGRFRDLTVRERSWENAWDDLEWDFSTTPGEEDDKLCGITLGNKTDRLWGADKKFLYGFWRDSFAVRQQLFLIFVRAEPTMMGGEGQTPPQLGARAVALVWRDPRKRQNASDPHQTRILFYRQFE